MAPEDYCKYEGDRVLLVEGKDDCHVILALCKHFEVPEVFGIYECGSDDLVLKRLNALILEQEGPVIIGIVLDADRPDVLRRWRQIQTKIHEHGYVFADQPDLEGTILQNNPARPRIGVWLMPNNQNHGSLEDFLIEMANPEAIKLASDCIAKAKENNVTSFREHHYSKVLIYTYLAWQDEPGKPLGPSITSHVLNPETKIAEIFIK